MLIYFTFSDYNCAHSFSTYLHLIHGDLFSSDLLSVNVHHVHHTALNNTLYST